MDPAPILNGPLSSLLCWDLFCQDYQQYPCATPLFLSFSACEKHFILLTLPSWNTYSLGFQDTKLSFYLTRHSISVSSWFSFSSQFLHVGRSQSFVLFCSVLFFSVHFSVYIFFLRDLIQSNGFKYLFNMRMICKFIYLGVLSPLFPSQTPCSTALLRWLMDISNSKCTNTLDSLFLLNLLLLWSPSSK